MSFGGSAASGGFKINMSISNYKNWPSVSGSSVSNFGNFEITGGAATTTDKTMSYNMNFADAGFNCDIKQTLVSGGGISVSEVEAGCKDNASGGAFSTFSGGSGSMTMSTKAASSSSTASLANLSDGTWMKESSTFTSTYSGSKKSFRSSVEGFTMMPKISGSGTDDMGAFTLSANSATDLSGSNTFWKTYTTGEMVQYNVAFKAGSGSIF